LLCDAVRLVLPSTPLTTHVKLLERHDIGPVLRYHPRNPVGRQFSV
jgi:hypothetical protein